MRRVIAFTGGYGSGKSTAIEMLKGVTLNDPVRVIKFAQPLYDIQEFAYRRLHTVYKRPNTFTKDRMLLQLLGTEWGRGTISQSIWVDLWKVEAQKQLNGDKIVVCDDCRFDNEAMMVQKLGGVVIKINRADPNPMGGTGVSGHASENGVSAKLIDFTVDNNGNLAQFEEKLMELFSSLGLINRAISA